MAKQTFDILPSKDIKIVKKDLKDIKKKLIEKPKKTKTISAQKNRKKASSKKSRLAKRQNFKVIDHKDIKTVKRDLKEIKQTLDTDVIPAVTKKVGAERMDNYYDLMPHKKLVKLEERMDTLKDELKKKANKRKRKVRPAKSKKTIKAVTKKRTAKKAIKVVASDNKGMANSMDKLSTSINNLLLVFEKAGDLAQRPAKSQVKVPFADEEEPEESSSDMTGSRNADVLASIEEVKIRLSELSMENEEMAKGILVIAEMLKEMPLMREQAPQQVPAYQQAAPGMMLNPEDGEQEPNPQMPFNPNRPMMGPAMDELTIQNQRAGNSPLFQQQSGQMMQQPSRELERRPREKIKPDFSAFM